MTPPERVERRLDCSPPFEGDALIRFLAARAVAGVEQVDGPAYRRVLSLEHGPAIAELTPRGHAVECALLLADPGDADDALARVHHLLDLDADPAVIAARLGGDAAIGKLVRGRPGLRVPRAIDGFEIAVRAIAGQQVSVAGARTTVGRLVAAHGRRLSEPTGELTHEFPRPAALADASPARLPFPRTRAEAIVALARAAAAGDLDLGPSADRELATARLLEIRGIGPWTASYVAMRALGDPDAFMPTDIGVLRGLRRLGYDGSPSAASRLAESWRPWRSYAVIQLWT